VLLTTLTFVAAVESNVTVAPEAKLLPAIVTEVPPLVGPEFGEMELTAGAGCGGGPPPDDAGNTVLSFFSAPGELFK
jgi:hypothetical protein